MYVILNDLIGPDFDVWMISQCNTRRNGVRFFEQGLDYRFFLRAGGEEDDFFNPVEQGWRHADAVRLFSFNHRNGEPPVAQRGVFQIKERGGMAVRAEAEQSERNIYKLVQICIKRPRRFFDRQFGFYFYKVGQASSLSRQAGCLSYFKERGNAPEVAVRIGDGNAAFVAQKKFSFA